MRLRSLGSTGLKVAPVSFGGITVASLSQSDAQKLVEWAIERGVKYFDCAHSYADTNQKLGAILPQFRDRIHLGVKILDRGEEEAYDRFTSSLKDLNAEHSDIGWLHAVDLEETLDQVLGEGGAVHALERAREEGLTRFIGITSHRPDLVAQALKRFPFDVVMVPTNYIYRFSFSAETALLPICHSRGIGFVAIKPRAYGWIADMKKAYRYLITVGVSTIIPHGQPDELRTAVGMMDELDEMSRDELDRLLSTADELRQMCRQCGYCLPCPVGIDIPLVLRLSDLWHGPHRTQSFSENYAVQKWAREKYSSLTVRGDACTRCGLCEERCPFSLPVADLIDQAHRKLTRGPEDTSTT